MKKLISIGILFDQQIEQIILQFQQKKIGMKAINVFYDPQEGSYYKIDKQSGQVTKSHRNGSDFIKFKRDYTGSDYRLRKENQKNLSPSYLSKQGFQIQYEHKHTVPVQTIKRQAKSQATLSAHAILDPQMNLAGYQSRIMQSRVGVNDIFSDKLKDYCKIKEELRKQNHSPREGYEGSMKSQKIPKQFQNQIIKGLFQSQSKKHKKIIPHATIGNDQQSSTINLRNQLLKQRSIFLRYNSHLRPRQNERQEKQLRQRKTNLKILQNLFLSKNNRQTSIVYE